MNIASVFSFFQLVVCLCMKYDKIEAVVTLNILKKLHLMKKQLHWEQW